MRVTPIKEIADLEPDEKVMAVHARVKTIYAYSAGTNNHGDWSIQNIIVADRSGEIKVKIKDHEEIPKSWKGRDVLIECTKHDKHGWIGVKAVDDTYKNKTSRILSVSRTGDVNLANERRDNEGGGNEEHGESSRRDERPAKSARSAADSFDEELVKKGADNWDKIKVHVGAVGIKGKLLTELDQNQLAWLTNSWLARANKDNEDDVILVAALLAMKKAGTKKPAGASDLPLDKLDENKQHTAGSPEAIKEVKCSMVQRANLMKLAVAATRTIVRPEFKDMSDEQFQSCVGQIYIGAERAGLHHKLPMVPMNGDHGSKSEKKKPEK